MDLWQSRWEEFIRLEREEEAADVSIHLNDLTAAGLEKRGRALLGLKVIDVDEHWRGRVLITLVPPANAHHPDDKPFGFKNGEVIGLYKSTGKSDQPMGEGKIIEGVAQSSQGRLQVTIACQPTDYAHLRDLLGTDGSIEGVKLSLAVIGSETTVRRRKDAIRAVYDSRDARLVEFCLDLPNGRVKSLSIQWPAYEDLVSNLNSIQRQAVEFCIKTSPVSLLHGPPGTGKTTTLAALIKLLVRAGKRVLVAAPSNVAVDNVLERCSGMRTLRLGHPARVSAELQASTFDARLGQTSVAGLLKDIEAEIATCLEIKDAGEIAAGSKQKKGRDVIERLGAVDGARRKIVRGAAKAELAALRKEARRRRKQASDEAFARAQVVFCTCVGAGARDLVDWSRTHRFDYVVVDEAGQATELETWLPALLGDHLILGGDHKQLPATVRHAESLAGGLGESLLARLMEREEICTMLTEQYRMNSQIMQWSSDLFYGGRLQAAPCVADRRLWPELEPIRWVDTAGIGSCVNEGVVEESLEDIVNPEEDIINRLTEQSKWNPAEAFIVVKYISDILYTRKAQVPSIGVISPYSKQVKLLQSMLNKTFAGDPSFLRKVKVSTVDGFQGGERHAIIVSLVRSNEEGSIGFLDDERRLNVAVTRAMCHAVIVGDSSTVTASSKTLENLYDYTGSNGQILSALEIAGMEDLEETTARGGGTVSVSKGKGIKKGRQKR